MNRREFLCGMGCSAVAALCGCVAPRTREQEGARMPPGESALNPADLSYCGVDCKQCDVFKATVYGDQAARMRAQKKWEATAQQHWGMKTLDPAILDCTGCRVEGYVKHKGHGRCPIQPCAKKRNLSSCGLCSEWRECERLGDVFKDEPQARQNLEMIAQRANKAKASDRQGAE